jgi:hypothetical protein
MYPRESNNTSKSKLVIFRNPSILVNYTKTLNPPIQNAKQKSQFLIRSFCDLNKNPFNPIVTKISSPNCINSMDKRIFNKA